MCFSAEASLAVGVVLLPLGAYATATALKKNRAYWPIAVIPLVFAVQQFCEAAVWAGLTRDVPSLVKPAALAFLFFALAFWPFWVPFSGASLEDRPGMRLLFIGLAEVGLLLGCACYVPLVMRFDEWVEVRVVHHSIQYDFSSMPWTQTAVVWVWGCLYLVLVFCPLLLARDRQPRLGGVAVAVSAVISYVLFWYAFVSVWCFFAALLSLHISYVLYRLPRTGARCVRGDLGALGSGVVFAPIDCG